MPAAVLPIYGGLEASRRCWRLVGTAGRIAERARGAGTSAVTVPHRLVGMLLANPTLVTAELAIWLGGHRPTRSW